MNNEEYEKPTSCLPKNREFAKYFFQSVFFCQLFNTPCIIIFLLIIIIIVYHCVIVL